MELTLTHLSSYLPYNLYVHDSYDNVETNLCGIIYEDIEPIRLGKKGRFIQSRRLDEMKPILRPLSDINSYIIHNECEINPIKFFLEEFNEIDRYTKYMTLYNLFGSHVSKLRFDAIQKLHEWKFDTQGLIENNLAIDINTLKENPYK